MATMRFRWTRRGYVAIGIITVAIAGAIGFRGESFEATVTRVIDGDTIAVQNAYGECVLRLWGADSPEIDQVWGMESKIALGLMCFGETVHVDVIDVDRYKRRVCKVKMSDGRDLADEMIRGGCAWWSSEYAPRDAVKKGLQDQARAARLGLWQHPPIVAPWTHRHVER